MARSESAFPVRKVTAGALAGAFTTMFAALLPPLIGRESVPPELMTTLTTITMTLVSYLTPPASGEVAPEGVERQQEARSPADSQSLPVTVTEEITFLREQFRRTVEILEAQLWRSQASEQELRALLSRHGSAWSVLAESPTVPAAEERPFDRRIRANGRRIPRTASRNHQ